MAVKTPSIKKPTKGTPPLSPTAAAAVARNTHTDKPGSAEKVAMNFQVEDEFRRDLKTFASMHGMSMVSVLKEGFELLKKAKGSA
jgi:hypothetical protein